jgi:hypothetical protein
MTRNRVVARKFNDFNGEEAQAPSPSCCLALSLRKNPALGNGAKRPFSQALPRFAGVKQFKCESRLESALISAVRRVSFGL